MKTIDTTVLAGYNAGIERDRLRTGIGLIEFERTKEILLPKTLQHRLGRCSQQCDLQQLSLRQ